MGAIADYAAYKSGFEKSQVRLCAGGSTTGSGTNLYVGPPISTPTSAVALGSADSPLRPFPSWPSSSAYDSFLAEAVIAGFSPGVSIKAFIWLIDRLVHSGGMSGTVTTEQAVTAASLPRYTDGVGVVAALAVYSALGTTSVTASINYTNQAGTSGMASKAVLIPANAPARGIYPFCLEDGDTGVQSVQGLTLSGTTGTAGNFGILLFKPLVLLGHTDANGIDRTPTREMLLSGGALSTIPQNACLDIAHSQLSTNSPLAVMINLRTIMA